MTATSPNTLGRALRGFFADHLPRVRGASPHTVRSYRDTFVLLLRFVATRKDRSVPELDVDHVGPQEVLDFLHDLEVERHNLAATRNVRLAAIHAFFRYCAAEHPERIEHCQRILAVPFKRTRSRLVEYLEFAEIQAVLAAIDRSTRDGRRLRAPGVHVQHGRPGSGDRRAPRRGSSPGVASAPASLWEGTQGTHLPALVKPLTSCVRSSPNAVNHQLTNHFLSTTAVGLSRASACGTSWRSTVRGRGKRCRRWRRSGCTLTACATVRPYTCSGQVSTSSQSASGLATPASRRPIDTRPWISR
jgi:hypothetical protein